MDEGLLSAEFYYYKSYNIFSESAAGIVVIPLF